MSLTRSFPVGYIVWDATAGCPWKIPFKGAAFRYAKRATAEKWCRPGKGRLVVPIYAEVALDAAPTEIPRICRCGRPENDHRVRHPFVPAA